MNESELKGANTSEISDNLLPSVRLVKKKFSGKYAIASEEFTGEMVGALVCNDTLQMFDPVKVVSWWFYVMLGWSKVV